MARLSCKEVTAVGFCLLLFGFLFESFQLGNLKWKYTAGIKRIGYIFMCTASACKTKPAHCEPVCRKYKLPRTTAAIRDSALPRLETVIVSGLNSQVSTQKFLMLALSHR